jgi:hydrogenase nickel incorporation protein HypA/HybF
MHEYSLARTLLKQVDEVRRDQRAGRVLAVKVRIGEFAGVEPELLASAFGNLSAGTALGGARLEMECVSLAIRCESCGRESKVSHFCFACPNCGSRGVQITCGEELCLESVTLECAES